MTGPELLNRIRLTIEPLKAAIALHKAGRMDEATLQVMNEHTQAELEAIAACARGLIGKPIESVH